ncbi:hypothetical protein N7517_011083 [Penicillium concentricum]|uniref:Uncharacterized protein n=1 Tax=Penicillium concentricum TaxID=293559 RepID=A0A9W9RBX0_9EURO|nr:uncharacterized protein N7517_011083 [Penicillium concentricum]KAJ5356474.1 hypothetical protein N7517_011083 [Penicillium concentricum]
MFVLFGAYYGLSPRAHSLPVGPRIGPKPNYLVGWVGPWALWALRRSTCEGSPTFQEEYGGSYIPKVIKTEFGLQVVAPDTPYVAVAGPDKLLFIDNWFEIETAKRMKEHIEKATVPNPDEYIAIDEVLATAEDVVCKGDEQAQPGRRNLDLKLPEFESAGEWLVTYDLDNIPTERADNAGLQD